MKTLRPSATWIAVLLAHLALPPASAENRSAAAPPLPGQRIFVTAHSFHIFIAARLAPLAKAAGIEGHQLVGSQMIGGSRVIQHWNLPDDKNKAKSALMTGTVDVLTMSPNLTMPDEGIDHFVELGLRHHPGFRALVQESWNPWDSWQPAERVARNEDRDTRPLDILRNANAKFKEAIETQVRAINQKAGRQVVTVVPVGDAVLRLRERIAAGKVPGIARQSELFTDPIGHGKPPIIALATYCNFACIYRRSPVGLKDPQPELERISPELQPLLQELAWEAVTSHPLSGVPPK